MSIADQPIPDILKNMFVPCHIMDRVSSNAGGSFDTRYRYQQGAAIKAMLRKDSDPTIRVAEANSGKGMYTVVVKRGVTLRRDGVIRRDSDGLTLKITGSTIDWEAPEMSSVPIAKTTAETWEIPT